MIRYIPRTEDEKIALIIDTVRWPGESVEAVVERLISEQMIARPDDRANFRQYAQKNVTR